MQPGRKRIHVRTGCVTCKRRRVKCTEEKPHCIRCVRGGFVCAEYANPQARIFYSNAELQGKANSSRTQLVASSHDNSGLIGIFNRQSKDSGRGLNLSPLSALKLGNSDPFNVYSIHLGPRETSLLQFKPGAILPQHSPFAQSYKRWTNTSASDDRQRYAELLCNKATAYGLLSRNAALEVPILKSNGAALPSNVLQYMTMTQAALLKELKTLEGLPTASTLHNIMWTSNFLATTELAFGLPTADVHISAMVRVMMRYVKVREANVFSIANLIHLLFLDIMTAVLTFKRCHFDTEIWLPRLSRYIWSLIEGPPGGRELMEARYILHETVKDTTLRTVMRSQKALQEVYDRTQENLSAADVLVLCDAVCAQELLHLGQLVNLAVGAMTVLKNRDLSPEHFRDESVKACLSISVQLWIRLASPSSLSNNAKFNTAPSLLLYLKSAIEKIEHVQKPNFSQERLYAEAKLWVLFVGAYTESQLGDSVLNGSVTTSWFRKAFRDQIRWMKIRSWQQGVDIFQKFLCCDYLKPPVSVWWSETLNNNATEVPTILSYYRRFCLDTMPPVQVLRPSCDLVWLYDGLGLA